MEPIATYRERGPKGLNRDMALYTDRVHILGRQRWRGEFDVNILLRGLEPDISTTRWHGPGFGRALGCFTGSVLMFAYYFWQLGSSMTPAHVAFPAIAAVISIAAFIVCYPMYKAYRFLNTSGMVILDVIESGPDKDRCEEFAIQISDMIRAARQAEAAPPVG